MVLFHQLTILVAVLGLSVINGQLVSNCPRNMTTTVGWGETSATVIWTDPTPPTPAYTVTFQSHIQGTFPLGISVVTYEFTDQVSQETLYCTFVITVQTVDVEPPVISNCPQSQIETEYEVGNNNVPGNWTEPTATDNSGQVVLVERSFPPDEPLYLGNRRNIQVTYTFEDFSGNRAHCAFNVRFVPVDTTPPTIHYCPIYASATVPLDSMGTFVTLASPDVTDNSGQVSVRIEPDIGNSFFSVGTTRLKYIYTDASGNESTCDVSVLVERQDISPPVVTFCPDSITYGVKAGVGSRFVTWDDPTAEDDSGTVIAKASAYPGFFSVGTILEVNYDLCDLSGNHVSCTFVISVIEDREPPNIFGCPQDRISAVLQPGETSTSVTWIEPSARDETYVQPAQQNFYPGDEFQVGITTIEYVFEDSAGNFAVCKFDVQVNSQADVSEGGETDIVPVVVIIGVTLVLIIAAVVIAFTFVHFAKRKNSTKTELSNPTLNDSIDRTYTALKPSNRPLPSIKLPALQAAGVTANQTGTTDAGDDNYYLTPAT